MAGSGKVGSNPVEFVAWAGLEFPPPSKLMVAQRFLRVPGKEIPHNIGRCDTRIRIEVWIERHLAGNVHRVAVPFVHSSDQPVELYFAVSTAMGRILLNHSGDVSLGVAQGGGCIEA